MAPALVEEVTQQQPNGYKFGVGQYKEAGFAGPKAFSRELELRGTEKHAPASYPHYLPVWDFEKKYALQLSLPRTKNTNSRKDILHWNHFNTLNTAKMPTHPSQIF